MTKPRTIIDCYRDLPESRLDLPESLSQCVDIKQDIDKAQARIHALRVEYQAAASKLLADLKNDWSEEELEESGMLDTIHLEGLP